MPSAAEILAGRSTATRTRTVPPSPAAVLAGRATTTPPAPMAAHIPILEAQIAGRRHPTIASEVPLDPVSNPLEWAIMGAPAARIGAAAIRPGLSVVANAARAGAASNAAYGVASDLAESLQHPTEVRPGQRVAGLSIPEDMALGALLGAGGAKVAEGLSRLPRMARGRVAPPVEPTPAPAVETPPAAKPSTLADLPGSEGRVYRAISQNELESLASSGELRSTQKNVLGIERELGLTAFADKPSETAMYANLRLGRGKRTYLVEVKRNPSMRNDWLTRWPSLMKQKQELAAELAEVQKTIARNEGNPAWEHRAMFEDWAKKNADAIRQIDVELSTFRGAPSTYSGATEPGLRDVDYPQTPGAVRSEDITRVWEVGPDGSLRPSSITSPVRVEPTESITPSKPFNKSVEWLHGTSSEFTGFVDPSARKVGHGVIYFSEQIPGRTSQAEHIAGGPFGGKLVRANVDASMLKRFDPRNDPNAAKIMTDLGFKPDFKTSSGEMVFKDFVEYPDMGKIAPRAIKEGYSLFRVHEPSVQGFSYAVANPKAISISSVESITPSKPFPVTGTGEPPMLPGTKTRLATEATGGTTEQVFKPPVTDDPAADHLRRTLESLGMDTRRIRTFDDMRKAAGEFDLNPDELLKGASSRPISDAEVVASANLLETETATLAQVAERLNDPLLTEAERIQYQALANRSQSLIERALKRRIRGGTESGRAVAAFRIIGNKTLSPAYWLTAAQRQLGDRPMPPEVRDAIIAAIQSEDRVGLARIVGRLKEADWSQKVATLVRAGMLTNPGTDVRNVGGNVGMGALEVAKDIPATVLDAALSRTSGIRTKSLPSMEQARAMVQGVRSGARMAGEIARHGDTVDNLLARYDVNGGVRYNNRLLDLYTQGVFRRLGMEDALFREPARYRTLAELAEIIARNENLSGAQYLDRVRSLIANPTDQMLTVAQQASEYATFNKPNSLAEGVRRTFNATPGGRMAGVFVAPFTKTPANIAEVIIDYSPLGMPKAAIRYIAERKGNAFLRQRHFVEGLGRSITGTTLAAIGWALRERGLATGGPTSDQGERALRRELSIPDYGIRTRDGAWVAVGNNAPLSNIVMLGVDARDQWERNPTLAGRVGGTAGAVGKGLTDQTFLRGVGGAIDAIRDPERFGSNWLEGVAGAIVPSLVGAVARGTDPYQRKVEGAGAAVAARVPGLRETLSPQQTITGQPRRNQAGVAANVISPVRVTKTEGNQANRIWQEVGWVPSEPSADLTTRNGKVKLEGAQLQQYRKEMGEATGRAVERLRIDSLRSMEPDAARERVQKLVDDARKAVRDRWKRRLLSGEAVNRRGNR